MAMEERSLQLGGQPGTAPSWPPAPAMGTPRGPGGCRYLKKKQQLKITLVAKTTTVGTRLLRDRGEGGSAGAVSPGLAGTVSPSWHGGGPGCRLGGWGGC